MPVFQKTCKIANLMSLMIVIGVYCVGGGMIEKPWQMMKSWMGHDEGKTIKAIPIPIPVLIKEKGDSGPRPPPEKPMKSKDWIWKLMMMKMMKGCDKEKGDKCKSKVIMFPPKNKCCDKGCCGSKKIKPEKEEEEEPEEDPYYYDEQRMTGWDTKNVPMYLHPGEDFEHGQNHRTNKFISKTMSQTGDSGNIFHYDGNKARTVRFFRQEMKNFQPTFENDFD